MHIGMCITVDCYNDPRNHRSNLCRKCFDDQLKEKVLSVDIASPANEYF